jgi:ABC-type metal ion transport system substrate-binding protein
MKKDNDKYKKLLELFEIDETTHQLDDNYDNLNDNQKKMFDPFFATKGADLHFYERLYFIPANSYKDNLEHLHQVEDKAEIN